MTLRPPDLSETSWLGAVMGIGGWIFGLFGVAAIFWQDPTVMLAVLAGVAVATAIGLGIVIGALRTRHARDIEKLSDRLARIPELETDLAEARRQAGEWSATSRSVSDAAVSMIRLINDSPIAAPPRIPKIKDDEEPPQ